MLAEDVRKKRNGLVIQYDRKFAKAAIKEVSKTFGALLGRDWAVQTLENGISETSVCAAAGWTSGGMMERHNKAMS